VRLELTAGHFDRTQFHLLFSRIWGLTNVRKLSWDGHPWS